MLTHHRPIRSIACVGEVMIEMALQDQATARLSVAGDTFNTAYYLNRLLAETGVSTTYVTALGDDVFSDRIRSTIAGHGIKTDCIETRKGRMPGLYAIETDETGERSFSYWRSASAARTLFSEPCGVPLSTLNRFDLVLFTGISMAILTPETRTTILNWIDTFRAKGGLVAYDSNHRPRLWESTKVARDINTQMWKRTDIALPSVDDELALFGDTSEDAAYARLQSYGLTYGALKRGPDGPRDIATGAPLDNPGPASKMKDSTAAGDSFNAGLLAATCLGKDIQTAMCAGHQLAAHVITQPGAIVDLPDHCVVALT
ncbi:sugar kinase [Shimia sp. R9_1]|uniref:sugar kinase n=1 Tax=Shimia sp. R9_1 TaxID=2821111 RepID=UPI001AD9CAB7|nr:sugar kinase [Shimia sp. R9_1]MBO9406630.1 sugar kinase [Shimia sp. R9_1]